MVEKVFDFQLVAGISGLARGRGRKGILSFISPKDAAKSSVLLHSKPVSVSNLVKSNSSGILSLDDEGYTVEAIWNVPVKEKWIDADFSVLLWKEILCVVGKISDITDPKIHFEAITCLVKLWDMLGQVRYRLKTRHQIDATSLLDFSGIIFKSAMMDSAVFTESVSASGGCICRIMCRPPDKSIPLQQYAFFYQILETLLSSNEDLVIHSLLTNSDNIFSLNLPGSTLLVPVYMKCIAAQIAKECPPHVISSILTILSALIPLEARYGSDDWGETEAVYDTTKSQSGTLIFANLKLGLFKLLESLLQTQLTKQNYTSCQSVLWELGNLIFYECLTAQSSNDKTKFFFNDCLNLVLENMAFRDPLVSCAAIESITLLVQDLTLFKLDNVDRFLI